MLKGLRLAIDGPSGSGKTTVSRALAQRIGFRYVDTGAMYRAVAVVASQMGIDLDSDTALCDFLKDANMHYEDGRVFFNGRDLTPMIRAPHVGGIASRVSMSGSVRAWLMPVQRTLAQGGSVVMEGRDIGTAVLKDADMKFFLNASGDVRAKRRYQ
ncbi:MAG: (d)CMP kinase, partial [Deltaproteobacteria bacterium]|nr:(d)CMP kinase [Deltaproteobacteria bacterium]